MFEAASYGQATRLHDLEPSWKTKSSYTTPLSLSPGLWREIFWSHTLVGKWKIKICPSSCSVLEWALNYWNTLHTFLSGKLLAVPQNSAWASPPGETLLSPPFQPHFLPPHLDHFGTAGPRFCCRIIALAELRWCGWLSIQAT